MSNSKNHCQNYIRYYHYNIQKYHHPNRILCNYIFWHILQNHHMNYCIHHLNYCIHHLNYCIHQMMRPRHGGQHAVEIAGHQALPDGLHVLQAGGGVVAQFSGKREERLAIHDQLRRRSLFLEVGNVRSGLRVSPGRGHGGVTGHRETCNRCRFHALLRIVSHFPAARSPPALFLRHRPAVSQVVDEFE